MAKNWLSKYDEGGNTPSSKYNSIPTGILKPPTVVSTTGGSYYSPSEQTIYLNPNDKQFDPSVYQHEMFHHWQNLNDQLRVPEAYEGPLAKPNMLANNTGDYYNRRGVEIDNEFYNFFDIAPTFKLVNPDLIYNKQVNPSLYKYSDYGEGEAEEYQDYVNDGGRPVFMAKGGLIKRADGSYSRRGLWDNIRANRGSGRKPTAAMLKQERKIKKKEDGSFVEGEDPKTNKVQGNNPLMNLSEAQRFPAPVQTTVTYPEGYVNQMFDLKNPILNTMGKPIATGAIEESASPLDFIGAGRGIIGLGKGILKYSKAMKPNYVQIGNDLFNLGPHPKTVNRAVNQMHKGAQQITVAPFANGGWIDMYNEGSWVTNSSIPTPTTPSFYPAGEDRTLTNYQMGTDKAPMYANGGGVNPIYVTDPNDPRLKAYSDSLNLYNGSVKDLNKFYRTASWIKPGPLLTIEQVKKVINNQNPSQTFFQGPSGRLNYGKYNYYSGSSGSVGSFSKQKSLNQYLRDKSPIKPIGWRPELSYGQKYNPNTLYDYTAEYQEPVQKVILQKEDEQKIERPAFDFSLNEDIQPIAPTKVNIPVQSVRRVMNPAFDFNIDFMPNRTKEAVVDQGGNPRYKYYNQDKVITEQEYKKLIEKKAMGGPVMYNAGSIVNEDIPIDPRTGKPAVLLKEVQVVGKRNKPNYTNVRESTAVNTPKINDPIITNPYDENWLNPDYGVSVANQLLKEHNVKVDSTSNILRSMGLPSSAYYNPITRTINYNSNADNSEIAKIKYFRKVVNEIPHAIQADRMGAVPFLVNIGIDALNNPNYSRYRKKGTLENEAHRIIEPQLEEKIDKAASNYPNIHKQGGPVMYREGATVWTNQDTPLYAAGTPTPTSTQNFRNDRSLNTSRYRIGDVIPTGMNYKTPAAGTYDYNKDVQPYHKTILHAPDTTMMARHGGHVNSPRVYGNPVNPSGMSQGPTTQRGITFGKGGLISKYADGDFIDGGNDAYEQAKAQYIKASNMGPMGENQMQQLVKQFPQLANDSSLAGYRAVGNAAMFRNNEEANRIETNTLGQVISTPASRKKAQREQIIAERPGVYNVEDYKMGIQEPGAPNDVTSDPISMAILGTAIGGIGLGARGVRALATDFAGNLASEATMGAADLTKGGFKIGENLFKNIKPSKIINNLKSTNSLIGEVTGELLHGNKNRKAIQEGNEWFTNWITHPKTQAKIETSINNTIDLRNKYYNEDIAKHVKDLNNGTISQIQFDNRINNINLDYNHQIGQLTLFRDQAKNFKDYSQEYPLTNQFKENFLEYFGKGEQNIHLGNAGISNTHRRSPFGTLLDMPKNLRESGNWISRKYPNFSKKAGTAIHENTHGWVTQFGINNTGQNNLVLNSMPKEVKDNYLKWKVLSNEEAAKQLGKENAFKGYIANPTEMHARTMELRKAFDLTPDDVIDEPTATEMMKFMKSNPNIITGQEEYLDTFGRDPKKMASLFNNLWVAAPAAIGASMYNAPSTQIEQKQANGGYVQNNKSNTWLDSYN